MNTLAETPAESEPTPAPPSHTDWHVLLGGVQQPLLTPVGIIVETELLATQKPPRIDILLLRRKGKFWTAEQQARLPDGIRQSHANHILIEFKYTQSVNKASLLQALLYDHLYRISRKLKRQAVQTFIVSARTPQRAVLTHFGYTASGLAGVYHSKHEFVDAVTLIVLNELTAEFHNAFFKCFATQKKERETAFAVLDRLQLWQWSEELWETVSGLHTVLQQLEGETMKTPAFAITPEYLRKLGSGMRREIIATLTPEDLKKLAPEIRQRLLANLSPAERLAGLDPAERLAGLDPAERLAGLDPAERLAGLDPAVIEAYLRQQQAQSESMRSAKAKSAGRKLKKTKTY